MNRLLCAIVSALLAALPPAARAQAAGFSWSGEVSGGAVAIEEKNTRNAARLNEYRDLGSGLFAGFDLRGRAGDHYIDLFGESLGREDAYLDARGGRNGLFRYRVYRDTLVHDWSRGALTPYAPAGSATLTAAFPSPDPSAWNSVDLRDRRRDAGLMFELATASPWFVRVDANQVTEKGLRLTGDASGTSPGNGATDKPLPLAFRTDNVAVEGGYASKRAQLTAHALFSRFSNGNDVLQWTNPFFGNQLDATALAPDSDLARFGLSGMLKGLPLDSMLSARLTSARTTTHVPIAVSALTTGGVYGATNPDRSVFDGKVVHDTVALNWSARPTRAFDLRLHAGRTEKDNQSSPVTFTPAASPAGLCGGQPCTSEVLSYRRDTLGMEAGYRIGAGHRLLAAFDSVNLERTRSDFDATRDRRASLEYRNSAIDTLGVRIKVQRLERRSHFLHDGAGASANDPEFLNRFVAAFDVANVDQDLARVGLDWSPAGTWDVGLEAIARRNRYRDTRLGRTRDERQELYADVAHGDPRILRVTAFANAEWVRYDSVHRNISSVSTGSGTAPNDTPSGFCQSTFPDCFDPFGTAANASNYNWSARNRDHSVGVGAGADWIPQERWRLHLSAIWQRTEGTVDFDVQAGGNAANQVPIRNFDNTRRLLVNLNGSFAPDRAWRLTAGYAFDRFRFDDVAFSGYQYTLGSGASATYLSGASAFPDYTAHLVYFVVARRF